MICQCDSSNGLLSWSTMVLPQSTWENFLSSIKKNISVNFTPSVTTGIHVCFNISRRRAYWRRFDDVTLSPRSHAVDVVTPWRHGVQLAPWMKKHKDALHCIVHFGVWGLFHTHVMSPWLKFCENSLYPNFNSYDLIRSQIAQLSWHAQNCDIVWLSCFM